MKIKKTIASILLLLLTATALITTQYKYVKATNSLVTYNVQAKPSDSFVESMGINTKFGYCPGRLCDNYAEVKDLLAQSGIRYIRDIPYREPWRIRKDLYQDLGIRMAAEIVRTWGQPLDRENISSQLAAIKKWGKMIFSIIGVNEYDNPVYQSCEQTEGCDPDWSKKNWSEKYTRFQRKVYQIIKSDRQLQDLPVVLGPMAHLDNIKQLGDVSDSCDKGNDHSYPGAWGKPSQESGWGKKSTARSLDELVTIVQQVCPDKKLWITETGYDEKIDGQPNKYLVSRKAKAKYIPRIYANYFEQGEIEKTFLYELVEPSDDQTGFGIIDINLQPTPAYYEIKNLISLLGEATWDRQQQAWHYPPDNTISLKYTLEGKLGDIKHLLLQKSDQTFYLLIWQEVYVYDNQLHQDVFNPERTIKFQLKDAVIQEANTYLLYNESDPSAELFPVKNWQNVFELSFAVPDHIIALEFKLKNYAHDIPPKNFDS